MFPCPHCGKTIEVDSPTEVRWYQYEPSGGVSLGCGTLILIALIVMIFSRGGGDSGAVRALQTDIQKLEQKIDDFGRQLEAIQPAEGNQGQP